MATAAAASANSNANTQTGAGVTFNGLGIESNIRTDRGDDVWSTKPEEQGSGSNGVEMVGTRPSGLLVRRASASGQLMHVDEPVKSNTDTADNPKRRRSLLSSSSSPTSLRALFNASATGIRSPTLATSQQPLSVDTPDVKKPIENALNDQGSAIQDVHPDPTGSTSSSARFDYFDHPIPYSGSSSSSSTPSGAMLHI
ncbi:hypothetical protein BGZ65_002007 [Modicella reniformis]|uniref:Uncharacterized protein n=1 Tax=Modicella reniformis TaxID=1440133 RepID=A0A9P6ILL5_9FUNG|nr:hypothetical protein BGZ65_002007 [Modicella reniformis]